MLAASVGKDVAIRSVARLIPGSVVPRSQPGEQGIEARWVEAPGAVERNGVVLCLGAIARDDELATVEASLHVSDGVGGSGQSMFARYSFARRDGRWVSEHGEILFTYTE